MEEVSWRTKFEGKLQIKILGVGEFEATLGKYILAIYFSEAYLKTECDIEQIRRKWRIERFSPEEGILVVAKKTD